MRLTGLNFEAIPPLHLPFRYYLTAPFFAVAAGILLMFAGETLWYSRWMPVALSTTHLIALGVMAMIMIGSLYQVLPVLCGAAIQLPFGVQLIIQLGLVAGTISLAMGFLGYASFLISFICLLIGLGTFVSTTLFVLLRKAAGEQTRIPIMLAVLALAIVGAAGMVILSGHIWHYFPVTGKGLTNLHAGAGIFGWVLLLVMAVSFQVIPMFHVTPEFPKVARNGLPLLTLTGLFAMLLEISMQPSCPMGTWLVSLAAIIYGCVAIERLTRRKRKLPDVVIRYWFTALSCLIIGCVFIFVSTFVPTTTAIKLDILIGLVIGLGFILGVIQGMLLKIVPFLINLHLQRFAMSKPMAMMLLPDHYSLISRKQGAVQYWLYCSVLLSIVGSYLLPPASVLLGATLALNWCWTAYLLISASLAYRRVKQQMIDV